jgi:Predicted transcriptional regulators
MYRIGEFSKLSGLSIDTLYHYEKLKIIVPLSVDKFTNYRYYDASQMITVNKILALKDAGFSLEEIAYILNEDVAVPKLLEMLESKAQRLETALSEEYNRLERLHINIFLIKNGGIPQMSEVTIKRVEPILIASTRRSFPQKRF